MRKDVADRGIDWMIVVVPFAMIMGLAICLFVFPENSKRLISQIRFFFGDVFGVYYLVIGIGFFLISIYLSFSRYGSIILGKQNDRPKYSFFTWGSMMFTCGLAADILFYSFSEWIMYATNPHISEMGNVIEWAGVYPLFHWSFIPWSFYLVLAVSFGFMVHCRMRKRQRYSEACASIIGEKNAHGFLGRVIDFFALMALLAGTATTFSVATPLMAEIILTLFGINISRTIVTIIILLITCVVYTCAVLQGIRGISILAKLCIYLFIGIQIIVFVLGGEGKFIIENGFQSFGKMVQNFIYLSTYIDPMRTSNFPQDWTIYYWCYWMVWCIATPFFIGNISKGRTIKQTVLGGYVFGVGSTISSFVILGNYSLSLQAKGIVDFISMYEKGGTLYELIVNIINTMPVAPFIMFVTLVCMIAFYATSFDSIAYTAACYSYKRLGEKEKPHRMITFLWCILLIILPIALIFSENSMSNIQSVSIISAFPIGGIMILVISSFFKEAKKYMEEELVETNRPISG